MGQQDQSWIVSVWQLPRPAVDELMATLFPLGAQGSAEEMGPDLAEEHQNVQTRLSVYFDDQAVAPLHDRLLQVQVEGARLLSLERMGMGDWATAWKAYFKPLLLASGVVIRPSWETYEAKADEVVVVLDPGMAFGTGQHDSTRFCAEFLSGLSEQAGSLALESLLDVGCGSGILALIGRQLGFSCVVGIDNDPEAIEVACENRDRNPQCADVVFSVCTDALEVKGKALGSFQVVVANIIAEAICALKQDLLSALLPGGFLILSGILRERAEMIETAFAGLTLVEKKMSAEWCAYLYQN